MYRRPVVLRLPFSGWTVFTLQTCHVEEDQFLVTDTNGTEIFMSKGDMPQRIGDEHEPGASGRSGE